MPQDLTKSGSIYAFIIQAIFVQPHNKFQLVNSTASLIMMHISVCVQHNHAWLDKPKFRLLQATVLYSTVQGRSASELSIDSLNRKIYDYKYT
jgi:hypothetical protein